METRSSRRSAPRSSPPRGRSMSTSSPPAGLARPTSRGSTEMGLGRGAFSGGGGGGTDTATVQGMIDASIAAEAGTPGFAFVGVNQGANATTALPLMFSSSGVNTWEPPASGFIEGLFVDMAGTVTAGTADFQMLVDAVPHTLAGEVLQISGASAAPENRAKAVRLDTPIWVSAGQKVGAQCVSVGLAPTTLDPR